MTEHADQPRLPLVSDEQMDPATLEFLQQAKQTGTPTEKFVRVLAHHPEAMKGFGELWKAVFWEGEVQHEIKESVRMLLAHTFACRN